MKEKLTDAERATLFLYILKKQLPPWGPEAQAIAFAKLAGESIEWAEAAFEKARNCGYAEKS